METALAPGCGLYAIVDVDAAESRGLDWFQVAQAAQAAGAGILQFRAKDRADGFVLEGLRRLRALVPPGGACRLFANDRADLAALAGVDGVHLGQDDLPVPLVRRHYPELAVGLSTHDAVQFRSALSLGLTYVALGPIFETRSKKNPEPAVGPALLGQLHEEAQACGLPVVAIGGIELGNVRDVREHARWVASISALLPPPAFVGDAYAEVEGLTRQLCAALRD